jgi:hypothetical protein
MTASAAPTPTATEGTPYTASLVTFTSSVSGAAPADFTATINWGDGHSGAGVVAAAGGNNFSVSGTNTYANNGSFPVLVTVADPAGNTSTMAATVSVANAPPTVNVAVAYLSQRQVRLTGHVTDTNPGGLPVTFTGMVTGTTTTDANGDYTLVATAIGLGPVLVSTVDSGGLASNTTQVTLTSAAPEIDSMTATCIVNNLWTIRGHVIDESAGGLTVVLEGLQSLPNVMVTVRDDGSFSYTWQLANPNETGTVVAQTTDWWGLISDEALAFVRPVTQ